MARKTRSTATATLESISKGEPPKEEAVVNRPEVDSGITRVTGRFAFEATIPTPVKVIDGHGNGLLEVKPLGEAQE